MSLRLVSLFSGRRRDILQTGTKGTVTDLISPSSQLSPSVSVGRQGNNYAAPTYTHIKKVQKHVRTGYDTNCNGGKCGEKGKH